MKTRYLAILAVLAVAFAAFAVALPMAEDSDATAGDYQPSAYEKGTNGMRAILYEDGVVMLDLKDATNVAQNNLYQATVQAAADTTHAAVVNNLAAVNGKIYLDVKGTDLDGTAFMTAGANIVITLKDNLGSASIDAVTLVCPTVSEGKAAAMTLTMKNGHMNYTAAANVNIEGAATAVTGTDLSPAETLSDRNVVQDLQASIDTSLTDASGLFTLVGWAKEGTTTKILKADDKSKIEDVIYALGDAGVTFKSTSANVIYLLAVFNVRDYNLTIEDQSTALNTTFKHTDAVLKLGRNTSADTVATASVTSKVAADSFALLKIKQDSAATSQYTYKIQYMNGSTPTDITASQAMVTMISNGVYKISAVKADLKLVITATESSNVSPTGYALTIDSIANATDAGKVALSLDLYDESAATTDTLRIAGTYYLAAGDSVKIYGDLDTLYSKMNNATQGYENLKAFKNVTTTLDIQKVENKPTGKVVLADADCSLFDLTLDLTTVGKTTDVAGTSYGIYAAQGLWEKSDGTDNAVTPWAIYQS